MIELDFFESADNFGVIKATVHKTGKLGFSKGASKFLKLEEIEFFQIGMNKADEEDRSLYFVPVNEESESSFKVSKAGEYYYINVKNILTKLGIDYKKESAIFDIVEIEDNNKKLYKLTRRK